MADSTTQTETLSNFKRNTSEYLEQLRESGQPLVLTVKGKPEVVVQDATAYNRLLESIDRLEAIEGIREGLEELRVGKGRPAAEVFEEIRRKHAIPRDA